MRAVLATVLGAVTAFAALADGPGLPMLRIIPEKEHHGGGQTFDVAQDRRGVIHAGTLKGVLTYDGAWWHSVTLPNSSAVFAVESDSAGLVAVGAIGELGYLTGGQYRSLLPQLPPGQRDVGDVRGLCTAGRGFVFASERMIIEWTGGAPRMLADFRERGNGPLRCGLVAGALHFWGADGLQRLERQRLVPAGLAGKRVDAVVETADRRILAAVRGEGLFFIDATGAATPAAPATSARIEDTTVVEIRRLRDGLALATRELGVLLLDSSGEIREVLNQGAGLPDDALTAALIDNEGALWLAYQGPLVRVDLEASLTVLDGRRGVQGNVHDILEDRDRLLITTSHGLYSLPHARPPGSGAVRVTGVPAPAWQALPIDSDVLTGTSEGVFLMRGSGPPSLIPGTEDNATYELLRSDADPARVWLATRKGAASLRRDGKEWRFEGVVPESPAYVRPLLEKNGVLWAGSVFNGIVRIDRERKVSTFGSGEMNVFLIDRRLVVTDGTRILQLDISGRMAPDPHLGHITVPGGFFALAEDAAGSVWINSEPPRLAQRLSDGSYARVTRPVAGIGGHVSAMRPGGDGAMWFASGEGAYRLASSRPSSQPAPFIRAAVAGDKPLPHDFGRLRIEFAPASYGTGVMYQYRLDPIDETWSEWTTEPFIDYTRLAGGEHTFRLRARGGTGAESAEARWSFTVLPPWYRTPLPIAGAVLGAAALILLIVKLRTRALHRQADRLRALVDERTQELSEKNELLQQANAHLERLSLLDELTGIPNRRYFDRALARAWETAREQGRPLALILLDLDRFKDLNDAHGHPAGDATLVQLGRLLAQKIRRSGDLASRTGDVVARIGGEEFAILLGGTDGAGAERAAETLRAAIEDLEIHYEELPMRVTASCGVAVMTPREGEGPELLVRRADGALYVAKAAGRNCVRGAGAENPSYGSARILRENSGSSA